jgi:hypothetical protein
MVGRVIVEDAEAPVAIGAEGGADATNADVYEVKPMVVKTGGDE